MNDDKLKQILKQESYKPGKNEWFTPRLLNKLPAPRQRSTGWLNVVAYVLAAIACLAAWVLLLTHSDFHVITVRDILYFTTLTLVSTTVAFQLLKTLILSDE